VKRIRIWLPVMVAIVLTGALVVFAYLPLLLSELAANGYTFGTLSVSGTGSVFPAQKIANAGNGA
jgi:hypothetical protein